MSAPAADGTAPSGNSLLGDVWVNFKRWNRKALRTPSTAALELFLAVFSLVMFTAVFGDVGDLALRRGGFAGVEYVTFLLPAVLLQVSMASAITSGMGLVGDLDSGMFETVVATPMGPTAVFAGKAAAELLRIVFYLGVIIGLALVMGATIETGLLGVVGIVVVCLLFASWYMALSNVLALVTRDQEALDAAANILLFPLLFLSSGFLPVDSLPGWVRTAATVNPVTYGVEAVRALVLGEDTLTLVEMSAFGGIYDTLVPALAVLIVLNVVAGAAAVWMLARETSTNPS